MRRLALGLVALLVVAAPAGADIVDRKQSVDSRITALQDRVAAAQEKEAALRQEIDDVSGRIRGLEQQVGDVSSRLAPLEHELKLREVKLNRLNALLQVQSDRLAFLRAEYRIALGRLNHRLVAAYESDSPDELSVLLSSSSFTAFLDGLDYIKLVATRDRQIADAVRSSRDEVAVALAHTKAARRDMQRQAKIFAVPRSPGARPARPAAGEPGRPRRRPEPEEGRPRVAQRPGAGRRRRDRLPAAGERRAGGQDPGGPVALDRPAHGLWAVELARRRADHEPVRLALGPDARGDRPRCRLRDPDRGRRGRNRHLRRVARRLRKPDRDRPRRRPRDRVRPPIEDRGLGRPTGRPRRDHRLRRLDRPLDRTAPPLRGASQRPGGRPAGLLCSGGTHRVPPLAPSWARSLRSHHEPADFRRRRAAPARSGAAARDEPHGLRRTCRSGRFRYRSSTSKP